MTLNALLLSASYWLRKLPQFPPPSIGAVRPLFGTGSSSRFRAILERSSRSCHSIPVSRIAIVVSGLPVSYFQAVSARTPEIIEHAGSPAATLAALPCASSWGQVIGSWYWVGPGGIR